MNGISSISVGCVGLLALSLLLGEMPSRAEETPPQDGNALWAAIEARAAQFTGSGYSMDKAAVALRPLMQQYYAKNYANWTAPAPAPPPEGKLRNLAETPKLPRFPLTDKIWTSTPGSASVCLWEDDKLAAYSFSVDDNNAPDVPFWEELSKKYGGLAITWNLISGFVSGGVHPRFLVQGGTWELWNKVLADGFHIASHSVEHVTDPVSEDGWPGGGWETFESQRQLDAGLPGHKTKMFVYPGSPLKEFNNSHSWRPWAEKYYAAARSGGGNPINRANQIDYFKINSTTHPEGILNDTDPKLAAYNLNTILVKSDNPELAKNYRGWATTFIHFVNQGKDWDKAPNYTANVFDWVQAHRENLWVGFLDDIALYGQERDTATLTTGEVSDQRVVLALSSQMDPAVFDYPLTVKVRLPDGWKGVEGTQNGKAIPASFILHEGAPYGLVKALPDRGEIVLSAPK